VGVVIGLTGGIGVGKSTVAGAFASRGALVIDVDQLGRDVLEPDGGAFARVAEVFGPQVVGADGRIDRRALAAAVFGIDSRLGELEAISHPAINDALAAALERATASIIVLDMAVLTESRLGWIDEVRRYHRVVVVEAPEETRLPRLVMRGMTANDAKSRMAAQASDAERRLLADLIVTNDGSLEDLDHDVARLWPTIQAWATQSRATTPG
jgi:dephospho-CoA kinase